MKDSGNNNLPDIFCMLFVSVFFGFFFVFRSLVEIHPEKNAELKVMDMEYVQSQTMDGYIDDFGEADEINITNEDMVDDDLDIVDGIESGPEKEERESGVIFVNRGASACFLKLYDKKLTPYSIDAFLPSYYVPGYLGKIYYTHNSRASDNHFLTAEAKVYLELMLIAAGIEGLDIKIVSAYRSYVTQKAVKEYKIKKYGRERADQYSADPGLSEHQLGTTVDVSTVSVNYGLVEAFEYTPEFQWLSENAGDYGFFLSYPRGNGFYGYEPWHYRYIGTEYVQLMLEEGISFNDLIERDFCG